MGETQLEIGKLYLIKNISFGEEGLYHNKAGIYLGKNFNYEFFLYEGYYEYEFLIGKDKINDISPFYFSFVKL